MFVKHFCGKLRKIGYRKKKKKVLPISTAEVEEELALLFFFLCNSRVYTYQEYNINDLKVNLL